MLKKDVLISVSFDRSCRTWNVSSGVCLMTYCGHQSDALGILVLSEVMFMTGSLSELKVWEENKNIALKTRKQECVYTLAMTLDLRIFICGHDFMIRVFQL